MQPETHGSTQWLRASRGEVDQTIKTYGANKSRVYAIVLPSKREGIQNTQFTLA